MNYQLRQLLLLMKKDDVETRQMIVDKGELDDSDYHPLIKQVHLEES